MSNEQVISSFTHKGVDFDLMAAELAKPGQAILDSLTPHKVALLHMAVGIAGEAGELLDAIKKHVVYNKDLDVDNVIEELGDVEFYASELRNLIGITREQTLIACIEKLRTGEKARYPLGYSDKAAQERADKQ